MFENFRKALSEVFSFKSKEVALTKETNKDAKLEKGDSVVKKPSEFLNAKTKDHVNSQTIANGKLTEGINKRNVPTGITTIAANTTINGDIVSESDIIVDGKVIGDIESKMLTKATGYIKGNIKCNEAEIVGAKIEGGINSVERISVKSGSVVQGDIVGDYGIISGEVRGKVIINSEVSIEKDATIIGDIYTNSISVEKGAKIKGSMRINCEECN